MSAGGQGGGGGRSVLALGVFVVACSPLGTPPTTVPDSTTVTTPGSTTTVAPTTTTAAPTTTLASCVPPAFELTPVDVTSSPEVQLDVTDVAYAFGEPPSGPNAMTMGPDGTAWIADTEALRLGTPRLLRIGCDGPPGTIIDLSRHQIASAVDVVADRTTVWVVPIVTTHVLGGITWLGAGTDGEIFVVVTELYDGPVLEVDQTVWRLSTEGDVTGKARVPLAERFLYLEHPLAVTPDGQVMLMLALEEELVVRPMEFVPELEPILPEE